jgi:adenosine deaminase CECR1
MLIADYESLRSSLIDEDRSLRREFLRTDLYSDSEKKADKILRAIRALEAATIWNEEHPSIPHPFPGMEFLTGMWVP